jgi:hypothetical protein
MLAKYISPANCIACDDLGWAIDCGTCVKARTHEAEVIQLGTGLFGDHAVVKDIDTGRLRTVSICDLRDIRK